MKSRYFKTAAIVLALAVMAAIAVSQTVKRAHMRGDGMFGGPILGFYMHKLDLTDAQQAQAKAILEKEKPNFKTLMQQMADGHKQMRTLEESPTFDEPTVRAQASKQAQTMTDLIVEKARIHSQLFQILTPDQKTKMTQLMDKHGHGGMRHHQQQQNQQQDQTPNQ